MFRRFLTLFCLLLIAVAVGCGGGAGGKKPTFKASGKLLVDDKPYGPAVLTLSNNAKDTESPSMTGNVAQDGTITFVTYGQEGAVAAGTYSVTMTGDIMTMSKVTATEPGTVEIKDGTSNVEVKLKSIPGAAPIGGLAPVTSPP